MTERRLPIRMLCVLLVVISVVASIGCPPKEDSSAITPAASNQDTGSDNDSNSNSNAAGTDPAGQGGAADQGASNNGAANNGAPGNGASANANTGNQSPNGGAGAIEFTGPANGSETPSAGGNQDDREPLFVDWPDPDFALFVTGRQNGYIEPCGCTGLANQKGGLMRRHSLYTQLTDRGWDLVPIDLGNQIRRFGMQPVIKFTRTFEVMAQLMDYQAIGFGPEDLRMDSIELLQTVENYKNEIAPFVSCNVNVLDLFETHRFVESGEHRVGITSVFADRLHLEVKNGDVEFRPAKEGLDEVTGQLQQQECDLLVLLAFASVEECEEIARAHPVFDVIVSAGGDGEPTRQPDVVEADGHRTHIVQSGYKGMHVGVIGFYAGGEEKIRYQRIPLDDRFKDSIEVQDVFTAYQNQLKTLGLASLGLKPVSHPSGLSYVGSEACADCHTKAYDIWKNGVDGEGGPHYHATVSLTDPGERTWVQRHFDPECLSCHVTGWNPQKFFPYESGYLDLEASAHLVANGCENCHGPGSSHVDAEEGNDDVEYDEMVRRQLQMRVTLEEAKKNLCLECHDLDNSPDFHAEGAWEKYWSRIEHYGKS